MAQEQPQWAYLGRMAGRTPRRWPLGACRSVVCCAVLCSARAGMVGHRGCVCRVSLPVVAVAARFPPEHMQGHRIASTVLTPWPWPWVLGVLPCRWYRAPELLFGAKRYGAAVDLWATGAVFAELLAHSPLFPGENDIDQIYRVMQVLGTPTPRIWPVRCVALRCVALGWCACRASCTQRRRATITTTSHKHAWPMTRLWCPVLFDRGSRRVRV